MMLEHQSKIHHEGVAAGSFAATSIIALDTRRPDIHDTSYTIEPTANAKRKTKPKPNLSWGYDQTQWK